MSQRFPKAIRLSKRHEYKRMNGQCTRYVGHWIVIDCRLNQTPSTRLGITVTRRYGKAHERNRFKRIVREAFRLCYAQLSSGYDLNIKPRSNCKNAVPSDVIEDLLYFLT